MGPDRTIPAAADFEAISRLMDGCDAAELRRRSDLAQRAAWSRRLEDNRARNREAARGYARHPLSRRGQR